VCVGCGANGTPAGSGGGAAGGAVTDPPVPPGLGGMVEVGPVDEVRAALAGEPVQYVLRARAYLAGVPDGDLDAWRAAVDPALHPGIDAGFVALHEKCPHLGCRVPVCDSSGWFECTCHGAWFTRLGEHRDGPGDRGMDLFPVVVEDGVVSIDTGGIVRGVGIGQVLVDLPPDGPHCVDAGDPDQ
jgi:cytochrome b6-f complex iron-sulfur subunit